MLTKSQKKVSICEDEDIAVEVWQSRLMKKRMITTFFGKRGLVYSDRETAQSLVPRTLAHTVSLFFLDDVFFHSIHDLNYDIFIDLIIHRYQNVRMVYA